MNASTQPVVRYVLYGQKWVKYYPKLAETHLNPFHGFTPEG